MDELERLRDRLESVERGYRRLRRGGMAALVLAVSIVLMGQARPGQQIQQLPRASATTPPVETRIRAEAFILVDKDGAERASLVTDGAGSVFFVLFDRDGRPRADMQVSNYGPSVNFYDPDARSRLIIGSTTLVASHVANASGIVERNTPSSIVLFGGDGRLLWRAP